MASSGSSPESHRPHRRRDLGRTSRSRDARHHTHIEEVDYDAGDNAPLPSINPPPGTEIARGLPVPDPPQPSDTVTGDTSHQTTTSHRTVSGPPLTPRPHHSQFPFPRPHTHNHSLLFHPPHQHILLVHFFHHREYKRLVPGFHFLTLELRVHHLTKPVCTPSVPQATTFFPRPSHFADNTLPSHTATRSATFPSQEPLSPFSPTT